jgi:uncharacterized protein YjeT (DUF2065 family)
MISPFYSLMESECKRMIQLSRCAQIMPCLRSIGLATVVIGLCVILMISTECSYEKIGMQLCKVFILLQYE